VAIAKRVRGFERVIEECHPAFVGENCVTFRDLIRGRLEVAIGLETVQRDVLQKLNKRMTLEQFSSAASLLHDHYIDIRTFILVQPPFMRTEESLHWARRSLDFAFDCNATVATLIPTRGGNGTMEVLADSGKFVAPRLKVLEGAAAYGLELGRGRVFTDLWDVKRAGECEHCFDVRVQRLRTMNRLQNLMPVADCDACGGLRREAD
jgi:radical SAM enzyme (TIGR01210 family)